MGLLDYSDDSMIVTGKYKCTRLRAIPAAYLLNIYCNGIRGCADKALFAYIERNIDRIRARASGTLVPEPVEEDRCKKVAYSSKKAANDALTKIRNSPGSHQKPVRSYECEKCSQWHLTAMPYEEWKAIARSRLDSTVKHGSV